LASYVKLIVKPYRVAPPQLSSVWNILALEYASGHNCPQSGIYIYSVADHLLAIVPLSRQCRVIVKASDWVGVECSNGVSIENMWGWLNACSVSSSQM
jgi:hypothetical protein